MHKKVTHFFQSPKKTSHLISTFKDRLKVCVTYSSKSVVHIKITPTAWKNCQVLTRNILTSWFRATKKKKRSRFRLLGPRWMGLGLESLTPCFSFGTSVSCTLRSLFSIRKKNAQPRKVEAQREKEPIHTSKKTERQNGFQSRSGGRPEVPYFPSLQRSVPSFHFQPPFISSVSPMLVHVAFKSHKKMFTHASQVPVIGMGSEIVCKSP